MLILLLDRVVRYNYWTVMHFARLLVSVLAAKEFLNLYLALQLHHAVENGLGTWRASWDIYVNGHNLVNAVENVV